MTTNNGYASRADFLAPAKRRYKDVTLPVAGLKYKIRSLTEGEKEQYEAGLVNSKGEPTREAMLLSRRRLIVMCLCGEDNNLLLSDADLEGMKILDGADLAYLQDECQGFVGFKKGEIDNLEKNSEAVPADNSPTV